MTQQPPPFSGEPPRDQWSGGQQPPQGGYPQQPPQGGYPQQPPQRGYPQQPPQGGYPQQPPQGGYPQQPPQGGYPQQPPQGGYPQQPPQGGWGPQGPGGPGGPYLIGGPQQPKRNRKFVIGSAALVGTLVVGGGAFAAVSLTGGDGGKGSNKTDNNDGHVVALRNSALTQVDDITKHLPGDTVAVATLNLEPGQAETVSTLKFLRKFPSIQREAPTGNTLAEGLLKPLLDKTGEVNYDSDLKPWFGGEIAFGADMRNGKARPVVVIKVTDPGKAKAGIAKLLRTDSSNSGFVFDGDYAIVSDSQPAASQIEADTKASSLADNKTFRDNMSKVPGDVPVSMWVDVKGMVQIAQKTLPNHSETKQVQQLLDMLPSSAAASLRFDQSYADLSIVSFGGSKSLDAGKHVGATVGNLPDSTAIAFGAGGLDKGVRALWTQMNKDPRLKEQINREVGQVQRQLGVTLPDDLATVLGSQTVVAVGGPNLTNVGGLSITDPTKAFDIATRVIGKLPTQTRRQIAVKKTSNGIVVANSQAWAGQLGEKGSLGQQEFFTKAVPNADKADMVFYADVTKIIQATGSTLPPDAGPIAAVGITAIQDGDATAVHFRLVVK